MGTQNNGNGKWQLAFWILGVMATVWLLGLTQGVVANEVRNVQEHTNIRKEIIYEIRENGERLARIEAIIQNETRHERRNP